VERLKAREVLSCVVDELKDATLVAEANVEELRPTYWRVHLLVPDEIYYDRAKARAIIGRITNAVDRTYQIYTDIHLDPLDAKVRDAQ